MPTCELALIAVTAPATATLRESGRVGRSCPVPGAIAAIVRLEGWRIGASDDNSHECDSNSPFLIINHDVVLPSVNTRNDVVQSTLYVFPPVSAKLSAEID